MKFKAELETYEFYHTDAAVSLESFGALKLLSLLEGFMVSKELALVAYFRVMFRLSFRLLIVTLKVLR